MSNLVLIITDEERYPPIYENEELKNFRDTQLPRYKWLRDNGVEFKLHHISSSACSPSRASILTSQYPEFHGLKNTYGVAKDVSEIDWIHPESLPTMGHYFKELGYSTHYIGKWHISNLDLYDEDGNILQTVDDKGNRIIANEKKYRDANLLAPYGFDNFWIGPERHGPMKNNCGEVVDPILADYFIEWYETVDKSVPFFVVISFINPHDIVLEPLRDIFRLEWTDDTVPLVDPSPTENIDHIANNKPKCQKFYIENYDKYFADPLDRANYRRLYYFLHKKVYSQIDKIITVIENSKDFDKTILSITSDHGDGILTQGGIMQKWHNAYQEVLHVPLVICNLKKNDGTKIIGSINNILTSHVDLLPTFIGLVGGNIDELFNNLGHFYNKKIPIGRNHTELLYNLDNDLIENSHPIMFTTDDEISKGNNQYSFLHQFSILSYIWDFSFDSVIQPNHINTVMFYDQKDLWKFSEYFSPNNEIKEYEVYNLTTDPIETKNRFSDLDDETFNNFLRILKEETSKKLLKPNNKIISKAIQHQQKNVYMNPLKQFTILLLSCVYRGFGNQIKLLFGFPFRFPFRFNKKNN